MKRAEVHEFGRPFVIKSYDEVPAPPMDGVVVKTSFCGVCHTDVDLWEGEFNLGGEKRMKWIDVPGFKLPAVLGHEIAGVIHSMGDGKTKENEEFKIGDKVIVFPWIGCKTCGFCQDGQSNFCNELSSFLGCGTDGGYSEYVVVSQMECLVKVSDSFPLDLGCTLACSALTGYHAVSKIRPPIERAIKCKGKAALLIVGAGGLGLWCLQTARASLPKETKIVIADITNQKLNNAKEHGPDDTVLWDVSLSEADIIAKTKAKGIESCFDAVIDFVNTGTTTSRGIESLAKGGGMALVGFFGGALELSLPIFVLGLKQISGVLVGSVKQLREVVKLVEEYKLKPPEITHITLEEVQHTIEKLGKGEITGRAVIKF